MSKNRTGIEAHLVRKWPEYTHGENVPRDNYYRQ